MEQIIAAISQKLGLPESTVRSSTATLLSFLSQKVQGTEFEKFLNDIPGARDLAASAPSSAPAGGGLGGLLGSMLGGQAADMATVMSRLQAAGLNSEQILPFVKSFVEQARKVAGDAEIDAVLAKFPMLQGLLKT